MPVPVSAKRAMSRLWEQSDADYRRQIVDLLPVNAGQTLLDVGCDDGSWTAQLAARMGVSPTHVAGIEIVDERRALAAARGYDVRTGDLEERWPFEDGRFDIVHANQVIEHVKRLDHFVEEIRRVLRPDGLAVVCTENLAAWFNVAALVLGYMPFSLTNISSRGPVGNPYALHAGEEFERGDSWQHLHVLTLEALQSIFTMHDFTIETTFGAGYYPAFGRAGSWLARRHTRHAHFIGVLARA
jgi:SAM-dependent methyltransferase